MDNKNYSIAKKGITHDNFDNEIVALNLIEGKYYSMEDIASFVWQLLQYNTSTNDIISILEKANNINHQQLTEDVFAFLQQLEFEGLIVETEITGSNNVANALVPPHKYVKPVLSVFTDMQEVIALDPVHDVSEKGWPHQKK